MHELIPISIEVVAAALEKAEHYRLLNEPEEAESICLDVLAVQPNNVAALKLLLLSRTDQFPRGSPTILRRAREVLKQLDDPYDRAFYGGLICECQAKYLLSQRGPRSGFVAYDWFQYAFDEYKSAMELSPERPMQPVLRWNTCVRMIERHAHCKPDPDEHDEAGIE